MDLNTVWDPVIDCLTRRGEWCFNLLDQQVRDKLGLPTCSERTTVALALERLSEIDQVPDQHQKPLPRILRPCAGDGALIDGLIASTNQSVPTLHVCSEPIVSADVIQEAFTFIDEFGGATLQAMRKHHYAILEVRDIGGISFSQENCFGIIFLAESRDVTSGSLSVTLIHEFAHQELFLLNFLDPLVSARGTADVRHSPFQGKPRPVLGRLHAAHALFRMTQFIHQAGWPLAPDTGRELLKVAATLNDDLLTPLGQRLLNQVYLPLGRLVVRES